jgi:hypothetical protein
MCGEMFSADIQTQDTFNSEWRMRSAEYIRAEALSYVTQPFRADMSGEVA